MHARELGSVLPRPPTNPCVGPRVREIARCVGSPQQPLESQMGMGLQTQSQAVLKRAADQYRSEYRRVTQTQEHWGAWRADYQKRSEEIFRLVTSSQLDALEQL